MKGAPPVGSGQRFKILARKLERKGVVNPTALAAFIGRKKYGSERFAMMAAAGRKASTKQRGGRNGKKRT